MTASRRETGTGTDSPYVPADDSYTPTPAATEVGTNGGANQPVSTERGEWDDGKEVAQYFSHLTSAV
jgi:hypothetical protein